MDEHDTHTEMSREEFERLAGPEIPNRFDYPQTPQAAAEFMAESLRRVFGQQEAA